jgi:hypothetical protein
MGVIASGVAPDVTLPIARIFGWQQALPRRHTLAWTLFGGYGNHPFDRETPRVNRLIWKAARQAA